SSSVVSINVKEDRMVQEPREDVDASAEKRNSLDVTATQVWDKLTETSILMSGSKEDDLRNRTIGVGVKQWFHHETFRYSIDVSRTVIEQPHIEILDYDSQVLTPPPVG